MASVQLVEMPEQGGRRAGRPEPGTAVILAIDLSRTKFVYCVRWNGIEQRRLTTPAGQHLLRITMAELERRLDPKRFARIHRSTMVNIDRIKEITPAWHGDFEVLLHDGQRLRLSRNFRDRLLGGVRP